MSADQVLDNICSPRTSKKQSRQFLSKGHQQVLRKLKAGKLHVLVSRDTEVLI
jgi:hypothetical protein